MRLTGADISNDTGCWQAAAFHRCTQLSGSLVNSGSPMSACLSAVTQLTHGCNASKTSLYSDLPDTSPRFEAVSIVGGQ